MPRITYIVATCLIMTWPGFFAGCTVHVDESGEPARRVDVEVERPRPNVDVDIERPKPNVDVDIKSPKPNVDVDVDVKPKP